MRNRALLISLLLFAFTVVPGICQGQIIVEDAKLTKDISYSLPLSFPDISDHIIVEYAKGILTWPLTPFRGELCGTVTEASTGNPLLGVTVAAGEKNTQTNTSGDYTLVLEAGIYDVTFTLPDFKTEMRNDLVVSTSQTTKVDVTMSYNRCWLTGRIVAFSNDTPMEGVTISVDGRWTAQTDSEGYYFLACDVVDSDYAIVFSQVGFIDGSLDGVSIPPGQTFTLNVGVEQGAFVVGNWGRISGQVIDSGTIMAVAGVSVSTTDRNTQTDEEGYYVLNYLVPGTYDVSFARPGYAPATLTSITVTADEDSTADMALDDIRCWLTGQVVDFSTGAPVSGATVTVNDQWSAVTDDEGNYSVLCDAGADYSVTFSKDGFGGGVLHGISIEAGQVLQLDGCLATVGPLTILTSTLPPTEIMVDYSTRIMITGGVWPYVFDLTGDSSLPVGLAMESSIGVISGMPTVPGMYGFRIRVSDAADVSVEAEYDLDVADQLEITTASPLPRGTKGQAYSYGLESQGGTQPYTYKVVSGELPAGMSLSADGQIGPATPEVTGSQTFRVRVTDAAGRTDEREFTLWIDDPLVLSTDRLDEGIVGQPYDESIPASGGYGGYQWSVFTGNLPDGLALDPATGEISGTPTQADSQTVVFMVQDEPGRVAYRDLDIKVWDPLAIVTTSLPHALVGGPYSATVRLEGGTGPFLFTLIGSLPDGLSLDASTGVISGTPVTEGPVSFTVTVEDSTWPDKQTASRELSLECTSTLTVISPETLPRVKINEVITPVTLLAGGGPEPYNWTHLDGSLPAGILLNGSTGELTGTPTETGDFAFTLQVEDALGQTASKDFFWQVYADLVISTQNILAGREGKLYSATVNAMEGIPPYTWSLNSGDLPPGITLTSSPTVATLSGTPTQKGAYTFVLKVSDSDTPAGEAVKEFTLNIYDEVAIQTSVLKYVYRGQPYSDSLEATGGAAPYQWTLVQGSLLPEGLTLNSTSGQIEGTSDVASGYSSEFTVRVTDSGNPSDFTERAFTLYVIDRLEITTETIPGVMQKDGYEASLSVQGGFSPYVWRISNGALPEGIALNGQTGVLTGRSPVCGRFDFTVTVTDSALVPHEAVRDFELEVSCCASCYEISGHVTSLAGVKVTLSGEATMSVDTDEQGHYVLTGLSNGNYTVTPVLAGYWMTPLSRDVTVANLDVPAVNFEARLNLPPAEPSNPGPADEAANVALDAILEWEGGDPDYEDTVQYAVRFGLSEQPDEVVVNQAENTYDPGQLRPNTTYYWKVVAKDSHGGVTEGPVWQFRTLSPLPFMPSNPVPAHNADSVGLEVILSWTSGDPDIGDTIIYDVYFGTDQQPPLVTEGQSQTTYDPGELNPNTYYYWKIAAQDSHGGVTEGLVWRFRTLNRPPHDPSTPSPADGEERVDLNVVLAWEGGDPDPDDTVQYDVYFGTAQEPVLVAEAQLETSYNPGRLSTNTKHYWKIVAKDGQGGVTGGPIWSFTTVAPGEIQFNNENYTAVESDGFAEITVIRLNGSQGEVTVGFATVEGTAKPDLDYIPTSGTLIFAEGETTKTFNVQLIDDLRAEPDETLGLILSNPQGGATLGAITSAILTIIDDPTDVMPGDVNNDQSADLTDLILVLQIISSNPGIPEVFRGSDINDDGKIGVEEALYIIQFISGLREEHVWP